MLLGSTWDDDHNYCGGFTYTLELVEVLAEAPISTMTNPNTGVTITKEEIEEVLNTIYTMDLSGANTKMTGFI